MTKAWFPFGGKRFRKGGKTSSQRRLPALILIAGIVSLTLVGERTSAQASKTAISDDMTHALRTMAADDVRNGKERQTKEAVKIVQKKWPNVDPVVARRIYDDEYTKRDREASADFGKLLEKNPIT